MFSSTAQITWLSGEEKRTQFQLAGSRHEKCFCSTCGSAMPFRQAHGGVLVVPAGSLDSAVKIQPNAHICYASRADWEDGLASLERFDGLPE
ncbi:GFA family protein [Rhodobacter sp. TJ_12]|uniref:GFA family protein n=1 Tax=Rhodobacter sp. TJ_12 TaxID=2029399 RepID=UPI001CBD3B60